MGAAFARFLRVDVANGDASTATVARIPRALLFRAAPRDDALEHLRDRANADDLQRHGGTWALLVHRKPRPPGVPAA